MVTPTRRQVLAAMTAASCPRLIQAEHPTPAIHIARVSTTFEREKLRQPFGFKGGYLTELWQSLAYVQSTSGSTSVGLGTQSVLWSDASIFNAHSEAGGNSLMFALLEYGLTIGQSIPFTTPIDWLEQVLPEVYRYGQAITKNPNLRKTFVLNALVPMDHAAWLLYARERGLEQFDEMIPSAYQPVISFRQAKLAVVPLISYGVSLDEVIRLVDAGHFFLKIKIGQPGSQKEMLEQDKQRLTAIHRAIGTRETEYTNDGRIPYYFDANGRYETKETFCQFLDHAEKIGAFDQIILVEEPFPEHHEIDVADLGVRIAADESAHTSDDVHRRADMGYGAVAVKGIAKTLSMTLKILAAAAERQLPCFCADLTVNPILVDWHKNLAARMKPLPGLRVGVLETNGQQNYAGWEQMQSYHPVQHASWQHIRNGFFDLDAEFFSESGGIYARSKHYESLFHA